jgi:hypothetical protein
MVSRNSSIARTIAHCKLILGCGNACDNYKGLMAFIFGLLGVPLSMPDQSTGAAGTTTPPAPGYLVDRPFAHLNEEMNTKSPLNAD